MRDVIAEITVPGSSDNQWFEAIGKTLAFLCVQQAAQTDPKRVHDKPTKVKFLVDMGLNTNDAAALMGTTANSVKTNLRQKEKKGGTGGKKKTNRK